MFKNLKRKIIVTTLLVTSVLSMSLTHIDAKELKGYSQNNVTMRSGLSESQIRSILPSRMKELSSTIYQIENSNRPINALFLASIVKEETGNGTSNAYRNRNNVGGIMKSRGGLMNFSSKRASLQYMQNFLYRGYINQGRKTTAKIGAKYCVGGNWAGKINNHAKGFMRASSKFY